MFSTFLHCSMVLQKTMVRSQELAFNSMAFNSAARLFSNTCRHSHRHSHSHSHRHPEMEEHYLYYH